MAIIWKPVNRFTRAGKGGKLIKCPHCDHPQNVYHFDWSALQCLKCRIMTRKSEWFVAAFR